MLLVVVGPWGEQEEASFVAGIELLSLRFGEGREAIFYEDDEGEVGIEGGAHDGLLTRRDGGGNEDGASTGGGEEALHVLLHLSRGAAAGHTDLQALRRIKESEVAEGVEAVAGELHVEVRAEEVRVLAFEEQAAGVVEQVVLPAVEFPLIGEDVVVVSQ